MTSILSPRDHKTHTASTHIDAAEVCSAVVPKRKRNSFSGGGVREDPPGHSAHGHTPKDNSANDALSNLLSRLCAHSDFVLLAVMIILTAILVTAVSEIKTILLRDTGRQTFAVRGPAAKKATPLSNNQSSSSASATAQSMLKGSSAYGKIGSDLQNSRKNVSHGNSSEHLTAGAANTTLTLAAASVQQGSSPSPETAANKTSGAAVAGAAGPGAGISPVGAASNADGRVVKLSSASSAVTTLQQQQQQKPQGGEFIAEQGPGPSLLGDSEAGGHHGAGVGSGTSGGPYHYHHHSAEALSGRRSWPWPPQGIAHRGASAELPEHTLEAYRKAIEEGADFIECDVVLTRDLAPVCRHSPHLDDSTDARTRFPDRVATYTIDGESLTGVFSFDLSLDELRSLRAAQPWPFRDHSHDGAYTIPTLQEYLGLAASAPRPVGVYPETKHPTFTNALPAVRAANTSLEYIVARALTQYNYSSPFGSGAWRRRPVWLQSFEAGSLRALSRLSCAPLVLLMEPLKPSRFKSQQQQQQQLASGQGQGQAGAHAGGANTGGVVAAQGAGQADAAAISSSSMTISPFMAVAGQLAAMRGWGLAAVGPSKQMVVVWDEAAGQYVSTGLVERAHAVGVQVHVYTFRPEAQFVLPHLGGNVSREYDTLLGGSTAAAVQLDALFTDHMPSYREWVAHHSSSTNMAGPQQQDQAHTQAGQQGQAKPGRRRRNLQDVLAMTQKRYRTTLGGSSSSGGGRSVVGDGANGAAGGADVVAATPTPMAGRKRAVREQQLPRQDQQLQEPVMSQQHAASAASAPSSSPLGSMLSALLPPSLQRALLDVPQQLMLPQQPVVAHDAAAAAQAAAAAAAKAASEHLRARFPFKRASRAGGGGGSSSGRVQGGSQASIGSVDDGSVDGAGRQHSAAATQQELLERNARCAVSAWA